MNKDKITSKEYYEDIWGSIENHKYDKSIFVGYKGKQAGESGVFYLDYETGEVRKTSNKKKDNFLTKVFSIFKKDNI